MRRTLCVLLFSVAGCAGAEVNGPTTSHLIAESSDDAPTRITISGDEIVALASPVDFRAMPAAARRTCEEMAPGGTLLFCASERNARGRGALSALAAMCARRVTADARTGRSMANTLGQRRSAAA